jgi:DNA-binding transcriptional LysR family regulator
VTVYILSKVVNCLRVNLLSAMATFVRVVDSGSLSKAARVLRVTTAAVSRQLSVLEADVGATLLLRTTRRVAVTEDGRAFYVQAARTLAAAEEALAAVRPGRSLAGPLVVSMPTALGLSPLGRSVPELLRAHPGLRIELRLEDQPVDLIADGVDVAVRAGLTPPDTNTLVSHPLTFGPRVVVASPAYLRRRGTPKHPMDLASHDALVHLHAGAGVGTWTLHSGDRAVTVEVRGPYRANALHAIRDAALSGVGVALLPRFLVAADVEEGRLRALSLGGHSPGGQQIYALIRTEARGKARVRAFLEHARTCLVSM